MAIISEKEAKAILEKVLSYSKADECEADLNGDDRGNIRYALNNVTTSGAQSDLSLSIQSSYGKRSGTTTINEFDDASLKKAVQRSEELARLAPENPEYVSVLGPQNYVKVKGFFDSTANISPKYRATAALNSIKPSREKDLTAAGFLEHRASFNAKMNSKNLFAYYTDTNVDFSVTIRTKDGTGSGWVQKDYNDVSRLDTGTASQIAIDKALMSREPQAIEPGKYTVILEPAASSQLLGNMLGAFNARSADEGRNFMSKKGGGNKLGEKIVDERITLYSDPTEAEIPASPWSFDGRPNERVYWIKDGVAQNLYYSRYWAEKKGVKAVPSPQNGRMLGGDASLEDLIKDTKKGILVTRLWYIRSVDPQTLLYTGLTRDGTFFIENGKIKHPIKNLRFNESPIIMLNNLEAMGRPSRFNGNLIPPIKVRDFTFTSLSDAV